MIRDADIAMYSAKESGRDAVAAFDESMRDRVSKRLDLERDLHHALERDELVLHYQPVIDMPSGRVIGFEALLRWNHPGWGLVSPLTFIPVAEETGLIIDIGAWALLEACRQMQQWRLQLPHGEDMTIAVNVSARQLRNQSIVGRVQRALFESGLPRDALTLELTESTLMENPTGAPEVLGRLKALGVGLAIDDFGTGYSSLAYLRRFPVDVVKIDRAFVVDLEQDSADSTLIAAIVAMSEALGVTTIAEGVESETQAAHLLALGCNVAQGYLFSRPMPAEDVPDAVERLAVRARSRLRPIRGAYSA
jgi:EAL domain-containing protein (putative c-di-GMP-specific phosphodiesterase class I)